MAQKRFTATQTEGSENRENGTTSFHWTIKYEISLLAYTSFIKKKLLKMYLVFFGSKINIVLEKHLRRSNSKRRIEKSAAF